MQLDGIFSYFVTRELTQEEIETCEYIKTLQLCPDSDDWDPYDESFAEREDAHTDYRGDLVDCPTKRRRLIEDADVGDINVSTDRYEYAISSVVARNYEGIDEVMLGEPNPQDGDSAFNMDDDFMQAGIADLSACFNEELFSKAVTERAMQGKRAMEAGSVCLDDLDALDLVDEPEFLHIKELTGLA